MIELKLKNTVIRIRFDFFAAVAVLFLFYDEKIALWGLYAAIIHEAGHLTAMFFCDIPVRSVTLYGAGISIDTKHSRDFLPCTTDLFILFAGAAVNFTVCAYCAIFFENAAVKLFGAINLVIGLFNLLPLSSFDGGRIISALIRASCSLEKAENLDRFRQNLEHFMIPAAALVFFILGNRNITLYITLAYFTAVTFTYKNR
jgi:Zn-dependent protease